MKKHLFFSSFILTKLWPYVSLVKSIGIFNSLCKLKPFQLCGIHFLVLRPHTSWLLSSSLLQCAPFLPPLWHKLKRFQLCGIQFYDSPISAFYLHLPPILAALSHSPSPFNACLPFPDFSRDQPQIKISQQRKPNKSILNSWGCFFGNIFRVGIFSGQSETIWRKNSNNYNFFICWKV